MVVVDGAEGSQLFLCHLFVSSFSEGPLCLQFESHANLVTSRIEILAVN